MHHVMSAFFLQFILTTLFFLNQAAGNIIYEGLWENDAPAG